MAGGGWRSLSVTVLRVAEFGVRATESGLRFIAHRIVGFRGFIYPVLSIKSDPGSDCDDTVSLHFMCFRLSMALSDCPGLRDDP